METNTHTDTHKDSNEYSIVAFCKNATINIHNLEQSMGCLKLLIFYKLTDSLVSDPVIQNYPHIDINLHMQVYLSHKLKYNAQICHNIT